eukprot:1130453-Pleurochrysis_carterae.AAC.2
MKSKLLALTTHLNALSRARTHGLSPAEVRCACKGCWRSSICQLRHLTRHPMHFSDTIKTVPPQNQKQPINELPCLQAQKSMRAMIKQPPGRSLTISTRMLAGHQHD